jgi:hypothetical protein
MSTISNNHRSDLGLTTKLGIVSALLACAGCAAAQGGDPTNAGSPPSAALSSVDATNVSIQGIAQASDGSPVAGVAVCVRPDPMTSANATCTTSDGRGAWKLAAAPDALVAITFIKTGFFPMLRAVNTTAEDQTIPPGDGALIATGDATALMGGAVDPERGYIAFSTATPGNPPTAAATVLLDAIDATSDISQPIPTYQDASGQPLAGASSGTKGVFANLPQDYYVMTFQGASASCSNSGGLYGFPVTAFAPAGEARMVLPVVAGFLTAPVAASCSAPVSGP